MLSKRSKSAAGTPKNEREELTLLCLPDAPLLEVLSLLPLVDLVAVGLASTRLGALTRAHPSLWWGKKGYFDDDEELLNLLLVAPPVDRLWCRSCIPFAHFSRCCASGGEVFTDLDVCVERKENRTCLIRELVPRLTHLTVSDELDLRVLFYVLQNANCLEAVHLNSVKDKAKRAHWPQDVVLPRLHTVDVGKVSLSATDLESSLVALRSLLQAHSGQLQRLGLGAQDVGVVPAMLRLMQGQLKELNLTIYRRRPECAEEVEGVLKSWSGPLEKLDVDYPRPETLRALGAGVLASLQLLVLQRAPDLNELGAALAGLPSLRSLVLRECNCNPLSCAIPRTAIPSLELFIVADFPEILLRPKDVSNLVRRAPMPLHFVIVRKTGVHLIVEPGITVLFRHSVAESECPLCAQAVVTARSSTCYPWENDIDELKVTRVQVRPKM